MSFTKLLEHYYFVGTCSLIQLQFSSIFVRRLIFRYSSITILDFDSVIFNFRIYASCPVSSWRSSFLKLLIVLGDFPSTFKKNLRLSGKHFFLFIFVTVSNLLSRSSLKRTFFVGTWKIECCCRTEPLKRFFISLKIVWNLFISPSLPTLQKCEQIPKSGSTQKHLRKSKSSIHFLIQCLGTPMRREVEFFRLSRNKIVTFNSEKCGTSSRYSIDRSDEDNYKYFFNG